MGNNCCSAKPSAKGYRPQPQPPQNLKPTKNATIAPIEVRMSTDTNLPVKEIEDTPRGKDIEMAPNQDNSVDVVIDIYKQASIGGMGELYELN